MKKVCKACKEFKEHEARGLCKRCYRRKCYLKNVEKEKAYAKKRTKENPEKTKEYRKKWALDNPEKIKAYRKKFGKAYYKKHGKVYRDKNKEILSKKNRKWRQTYNGKISMRRRRIKRKTHGEVRLTTIKKLLNENILKYGIITCEQDKKPCPNNYHIDHIIPVSKGGSNDYDNLQILCAHCNLSKHTTVMDYRKNVENNQMFLK